MTEHQQDVIRVAVDLARSGAVVEIAKHVFGFVIQLIPLEGGRFKAKL